jgi:hypothetical protein
MPNLRAKMRVYEVAELKGPDGEVLSERVKLSAVYGDSPENKEWARATPAGQLELTIDNPGAFGALKYGDEVYLDLTVAAKQEAAAPAA